MNNALTRSLVKRQTDGWQFARVADTNEFVVAHVRDPKGVVKFFLRNNAEGALRVVVGNTNYGTVVTVDDVKHKLLRYFKGDTSERLPKLLRGSEHELGDELKSLVLRYLRNELCEVTFVKADNTKRIMLCTLMVTFLPELDGGSSTAAIAKRENNPWLITAWDVEKEEWRSFSLERLLRVSYI